jgi:hypothetical protein
MMEQPMPKFEWLWVLFAAFVISVPIAAHAESQHIQGDQFITAMQDNTLSGTNASGSAFNIYFLPGGEVTYNDKAGVTDKGTWHLDKEGDVCVAWQSPAEAPEGCFRVSTEGNKVMWHDKQNGGRGFLRGGVTETFLTHNQ